MSQDRVGTQIVNKKGITGTVVEYNAWNNVIIEVDSGHRYKVEWSKFLKGNFRDPFQPNVYGVGFVGVGEYNTSSKYPTYKAYKKWVDLLKRCYSEREHKRYPRYKDCEVADEFKCLQDFVEWYYNQVGCDEESWHLDKDLLGRGNTIYGPNTCVLVPCEVNTLLLECNSARGDLPVGVSRAGGKYFAQCCALIDGVKKQHFLGYFKTPEEAFAKYKEVKEIEIKRIAEKWKGKIDDRAYHSLMQWEINP